MDLGKMLAEAIESALEGNGQVVPHRPHYAVVRGEFDLTAAAEAFLVKVREAEGCPGDWQLFATAPQDGSDIEAALLSDTPRRVEISQYGIHKVKWDPTWNADAARLGCCWMESGCDDFNRGGGLPSSAFTHWRRPRPDRTGPVPYLGEVE